MFDLSLYHFSVSWRKLIIEIAMFYLYKSQKGQKSSTEAAQLLLFSIDKVQKCLYNFVGQQLFSILQPLSDKILLDSCYAINIFMANFHLSYIP